jgi:trehalose 6-phosphate phosphatase
MVIELRPQGMERAGLRTLIDQRKRPPSAVMFCGDDLGDVAALDAVRTLRGAGLPGLTVFSGSAEVTELAQPADLVVNGPDGVVALLNSLADALS